MLCVVIVLCVTIGDGNVTRPTVADVHVHENSSEFLFKENLDISSLWPGKSITVQT